MTARSVGVRPGSGLLQGNGAALPINGLLLVSLLLLVVGLMMMTSASIEISSGQYSDPLHYFKRQVIFAAVGLLVMLVTVNIPTRSWYSASKLLLLLAYILLVLVLIPGIGKVVNGSARWIPLGLFNLQPSEPGKLFLVLYLAAFLERHQEEVRDRWSGFFKPLLVIGPAVVLLQREPDHGAIVILLAATFSMLFLAGARLHRFLLVVAACVSAVVVLAIKYPYVIERFTSFMNPWADEYVYGSGYQLTQALIAFGRGEWFGVGLGNSIQKLYFLPEAHTDFVLAILAEELGLLGVSVVLALLTLLVYCGLSIGRAAERKGLRFQAYSAYGISVVFASQILINVGVNTGLLPTKGLTLPFISYGGASLIISCMMVAIMIRIQYETDRVPAPRRK
ncbi:MAG: putative lipid II flippase FtsW [Gammaproteobacteria bacterium]|jgi:cell division protein FtsW